MPFREREGLRFYQFDLLSDAVVNAVFTRRGGASPAPWRSLNVGGSVGDEPARVAENRNRMFNAIGREPASIHDAWLVHGTEVVHAEAPRALGGPAPRADILMSANPGVTLFMRFADCVPLLFFDPSRHVAGIAHAGWQGTLRGAAPAAVEAMRDRYNCRPKDILAGIGPSIGVDHYQVGADVADQYRAAFGEDSELCLESRGGITYLDLWTANYIQLKKAGLEQIEVAGVCTACHLEDWFSHRAEKGRTGRFGAVIGLRG
jgi:hypothetical protein